MKKKCLMLIMAGIMCFNFVGCTSKETEVNSNYDVQEALDKYKEENEKNKKEITNEIGETEETLELLSKTEKQEIANMLYEYSNQYYSNIIKESELLSVNVSYSNHVSIDAKNGKYEALSHSLAAENKQGYDERVDNVSIHRADKEILSLLETGVDDENKVYYNSRTYDVASGKELKLSDVVTNIEGVKDIIRTWLGDNTISLEDNNVWTIGYEGLTVYIQSGNSKAIPVFISYEQYADLFIERIKNVPSNYVTGFSEYNDLVADLDGDGVYDTIQMHIECDEDNYVSKVSLTSGNQEVFCDYIQDTYANKEETNGCFIQKADGSKFIYICTNTNLDYVYTHNIFKIDDGNIMHVDAVTDFFKCSSLTNPEWICVLKECMLTGFFGDEDYSYINAEGYVESYTNVRYCYQVTTLNGNATGKIIDFDSNIKNDETVTVQKGQMFMIFRTDGEEYVDFILTDGRICRLDYEEVDDIGFLRWDIEFESEPETEEVSENSSQTATESKLFNEDFEAEYKGYIINAQTSEKDIKETLGVPEDFEINNNGYISTQYPNKIWQLIYPNYSDEHDIRVIFYTNLDTDVTTIKTVALEKTPTSRGIISGDSVEKVYEAYGLPSEEKTYNNIDGLLEVNYIKDTQMLSFVIDEESSTVEYIYINYSIDEE